jgi:hypothetical protein
MPLFFRFMTIMAFMVFLEKKVDVAIIEVGIGGEYDCTNVLRYDSVISPRLLLLSLLCGKHDNRICIGTSQMFL